MNKRARSPRQAPYCQACSLERVAELQFQHLATKLQDMQSRVDLLENTLGKGILLLVANLAGVIVTLAQNLL